MYDIIGMVGAGALAICALPLSIEAVVKGKVAIQSAFLALWFIGEVLLLIYAISLKDGVLIFNYGANVALLLPVVAVQRRKNEA